jgi:hypothetical protein
VCCDESVKILILRADDKLEVLGASANEER